jgi:GTP-binding protein
MGRSDVAVLLLDAVEGITEQDTKIAGMILKQGRACILVVNKWDQKEGDPRAREEMTQQLRRRYPFLQWAPVLFCSALKPDSVRGLFPLIQQVMKAYTQRLATGPLNKFLQTLLETHPLPVKKGSPKGVKSVYITQVATKPPAFALFVGRPEDIDANYLRFLENRLRERHTFTGTPIRILIRKK